MSEYFWAGILPVHEVFIKQCEQECSIAEREILRLPLTLLQAATRPGFPVTRDDIWNSVERTMV